MQRTRSKKMAKRRVKLDNLEVGMIVADDVYTESDQLIIPKRSIMNEKLMTKLKLYGVPAISIVDFEPSYTENSLSSEPRVLTQSEKVKSSEEYKEYKKKFSKKVNELQSTFKDVASKGLSEDEADSVMEAAQEILKESLAMPSIFDMLHNMREMSDSVYSHSVNVSLISAILGKWLRFSQKDIEILAMAGMFHDVGKLLIPENILLKPYKLTEKEFDVMKTHTYKGYQLLKDMDINNHIKYVALMHHERCDGSGYPMGIKGDKIDKFAKIVAIADVYDAMTSSRVYRDPICPFVVISNFEQYGFQLYEIEYIMTFLKNIANTYINSQVRLSNGMVGEIIMINSLTLSKPVVKVGETYMDLSKETQVGIEFII